jgi:hypothetical protein
LTKPPLGARGRFSLSQWAFFVAAHTVKIIVVVPAPDLFLDYILAPILIQVDDDAVSVPPSRLLHVSGNTDGGIFASLKQQTVGKHAILYFE